MSLIFKNIENGLLNNSNQKCFARKIKGKWQFISNKEYIETANNLAYGLMELGINREDKVIILSENRPEWNFVDLALLKLGIVSVPLYATIEDKQLLEILNETEAKIIFVSTKFLFRKVNNLLPKARFVKYVYTFNNINDSTNYYDLISLGKENQKPLELYEIQNTIKPSDIYSILYTSGTTGSAKGVMLTHEGHSIVIDDIGNRTNVKDGYRTILYLPLNNSFGRTITYMAQIRGLTTYYIDGLATILNYFQEIKPNFFPTVPILLEKILNNIISRGEKLKGEAKQYFEKAKNIFDHFIDIDNLSNEEKDIFPIIDEKLFKQWRQILGGEMKVLLTDGAQVAAELIHFYHAIGISILSGYGLTETSGLISADTYNEMPKANFCGKKITGMTVKLSDDGEILARGKNLMVGYFKHPEITAETIDKDGWIHTGDIGIIDKDGYIGVIGRKKSAFKNAAGTFVYPEPIEDILKKSDFIAQALVTGLNKPYLVALILPDKNFIQAWANNYGITSKNIDEIIHHPEVKQSIDDTINQYNKTKLNKPDMILKYSIISDEWSVETGELTPTMKIKRNFVLEKYKKDIEKLY